MSAFIIVFGAAVRPDGTPSGTLSRRIQAAAAALPLFPGALFIATGGLGAGGFIEADVIKLELIKVGIPEHRIIVEPAAVDTLQSVLNCHAILHSRRDVDLVIPCTSSYHVFRCGLLLSILGWRVGQIPIASEWGKLPLLKLVLFSLKECIATPYDVALLLWRRPRLSKTSH